MAKKPMGTLIIGALVILLLILHQDNWLWENGTLVLGFIPVGLFYHACLSVAASVVWFIATRIAWPSNVEMLTEAPADEGAAE